MSLIESRPCSGEDRSIVVPDDRFAVFRLGRVLALEGGRALEAVRSLLDRNRRVDMLASVEESGAGRPSNGSVV